MLSPASKPERQNRTTLRLLNKPHAMFMAIYIPHLEIKCQLNHYSTIIEGDQK